MKIRDFAKAENISVRTLRYYVQAGLLVPGKKDGQLEFDESCESDLNIITDLKAAGLCLREILVWMEEDRNPGSDRCGGKERQLVLLQSVRNRLASEEKRIDHILLTVEEELEMIRRLPSRHTMGIHTDLLPLLCCPYCGSPLNYEGARLIGQELREGNAYCSCGYQGAVKDGIFISGGRENQEKIVPIDTNRETYGRLKPEGISMLQKNVHWILKKLQSQCLGGKVIFENFINTICFLSTSLQFLDPNAYYIIADSDYHVVADVKSRIETLDLPLKILFLVDDSLNYPLKKHCIDIVLDYFHSEIIQGFRISSLEKGMLPFVHKGSLAVGIYTYIKKGTRTLKNNRRMFPDSFEGRYQLKAFKESFKSCGLNVLEQVDENVLTYSVIEAYGEGDLLGEYCFLAVYDQDETGCC